MPAQGFATCTFDLLEPSWPFCCLALMTMEISSSSEGHPYVLGDDTGMGLPVVTEHARQLAGEHWAELQYQHLARIDRESEEVGQGTQGNRVEDRGGRPTSEVVQHGSGDGTEREAPSYETGPIPVYPLYANHSQNTIFLSEDDVVASLDRDERDLLRNLRTLLPPSIARYPSSPTFPARQWSRYLDTGSNPKGEPEESPFQVPMTVGFSSPLLRPLPSVVLDPDGPPVTCTFGIMNHSEKLSFVTQDFRPYGDARFGRALYEKLSDSIGLVFLVITNWQPWFLTDLRTAIHSFPAQPVLHLSDNRGTTMLPLVDHDLCEMSCVMEHIDTTTSDHEASQNVLRVGSTRVISRPLVVWTAARSALQGYPWSPLMVVVSGSAGDIVSKIANHYIPVSRRAVKHERWNRLRENQTWIYLDLCFLFTHWENVWGTVKQNLHFQTQEVLGRRNLLSILDQTRQLHTDNNVMISLREHLRIHKASLRVVIQRTKQESEGQSYWQSSNVLRNRLDDASELLEYFDVTATSLLEHQQNLLSLAFNLETVIQGQAVARLNALAFVFLPLSFVAGIFGITTFTASPHWYPVAAVPTVVLTIGVAYLSNWLFSFKNQPNSGIPTETDIEKHRQSKMGSNTNTINYSWKRRAWNTWKLYQQNLSQIFIPKSAAPPSSEPFSGLAPQHGQYVPDSRPSQMSYTQMIPSAGLPRPARIVKRSLNIFSSRRGSNFPASAPEDGVSNQSVGWPEAAAPTSYNSMRLNVPSAYGSYTGIQTPLSAPSPYFVLPRAGPPEPKTAPPPTQLTRRNNSLLSTTTAVAETAEYQAYRPYTTENNAPVAYAFGHPQVLTPSSATVEEIQLETTIRTPTGTENVSIRAMSQSQPAGEIRVVATETGDEEVVPVLETIPE